MLPGQVAEGWYRRPTNGVVACRETLARQPGGWFQSSPASEPIAGLHRSGGFLHREHTLRRVLMWKSISGAFTVSFRFFTRALSPSAPTPIFSLSSPFLALRSLSIDTQNWVRSAVVTYERVLHKCERDTYDQSARLSSFRISFVRVKGCEFEYNWRDKKPKEIHA